MDEVPVNKESKYGAEFREIGHCGGQFTVNVKTSEGGRRAFQLGVRHSRPTPASYFAIYSLPQGIPVGTIQLGGIGVSWNTPPTLGCFSIFIGSDSLGMFGHQCPRCEGYWRSKGAPSRWLMTCPYCGTRAEGHAFRTEGQLRYIKSCCELIEQAMRDDKDGEHVINMDEVADAIFKDGPKPKFYYTEETQQNQYKCSVCADINDILGRYGYCSCCGSHNGLQELGKELVEIRNRINATQQYSSCTRDAVAAFDSFARQIAKQLVMRIPMTQKRRKEWERQLFHNLRQCVDDLKSVFDIDLFKDLSQSDKDFAILMFCRRHVYEHNGGEVDEKYIRDSGDTAVKLKQVIRESSNSAHRIVNIVAQLGKNFHDGFHSIFTPEELPVSIQQDHVQQMKKSLK